MKRPEPGVSTAARRGRSGDRCQYGLGLCHAGSIVTSGIFSPGVLLAPATTLSLVASLIVLHAILTLLGRRESNQPAKPHARDGFHGTLA
jgi:hypothetical protein